MYSRCCKHLNGDPDPCAAPTTGNTLTPLDYILGEIDNQPSALASCGEDVSCIIEPGPTIVAQYESFNFPCLVEDTISVPSKMKRWWTAVPENVAEKKRCGCKSRRKVDADSPPRAKTVYELQPREVPRSRHHSSKTSIARRAD